MGNEPVKMYSYVNEGQDSGMFLISKLMLDHWDSFQTQFNELSEDDKNKYEVALHKVHKHLGKAFTSGDKEEFEKAITDMGETEPLIEALSELKLIALTEENAETKKDIIEVPLGAGATESQVITKGILSAAYNEALASPKKE